MTSARFRRPDGRDGTYGQWLAEVSAKWNALSGAEQTASRDAAVQRLSAQIKAQDSGPTLMHLYDEIGYFGVWPADVVEALAGIRGNVEVHINSPGGNVFDGLAIYAALKDHRGRVSTVVDGLAASAASFIAMAAAPGELATTPNGTMMIHDAWGLCGGNSGDMRKMADLLDETSDNIASIYAERGAKTPAEFRDLMRAETWAVGPKAVDLGLADTVRQPAGGSGATVAPAAGWQVTILAAAPDVRAAWDGDAAMAAAGNSDDPAAAFKSICAGRRAGDPSQRKTWALPHHDSPGGPANPDGVSAALGRLDSTQGLINKDAAEAHLKAHQGSSSNHADQMPAWLSTALTAKEAANR